MKEEDGRAIDLFSGQETTVYGALPSQTALSQVEFVVEPRHQDQTVTSMGRPQDGTVISEQVPASDFGG